MAAVVPVRQVLPTIFLLLAGGAGAPVDLSLSGFCFKAEGFPEAASERTAPRPFKSVCNTPTSARFLMDARGVIYNGRDEDEITMDIISQGPIPWSVSRFNQGDFAPRIGPKWQASQTNLGVKAPIGGSSLDYSAAHCSQAWRPHRSFGITLPTVAKNGQDWGDGLFYGTAAISSVSGGFGYSMVDGSFGQGDCDVIVGKAGDEKEANIDTAVSWIPYTTGFPAGFVAAPVPNRPAAWQEPGSHSPLLPVNAPQAIHWELTRMPTMGGNHCRVTIPGYNARDGLLFAANTDGGMKNNDLNIVSVRPAEDGVAWTVQVHEDFDPNRFKLAPMYQWMFCFLFVPFEGVDNLHAAHVDGVTGVSRIAGNVLVQKIDTGRYWLRIPGKGPLDGVWVLQCAGKHRVVPGTLNAFLSYEWDERAGAFAVEVRHVSSTAPPRDHTRFGRVDPSLDGPRPQYDLHLLNERFPPSDADFFALWMDHRNPPVMSQPKPGKPPVSEKPDASAPPVRTFVAGFMLGGALASCAAATLVLLYQGFRGRPGGEARLVMGPGTDMQGLASGRGEEEYY